ncbi:mechanosensitive ion channel family protein [Dendrosporobacter sp. 1207_IL3150]|uniref:mechanosensitive ion channel family protein n=1 Tax=Dendrosporobacter sp. 1207_IL3150 TaxID=3084054 RepID=UPI002FDB7794
MASILSDFNLIIFPLSILLLCTALGSIIVQGLWKQFRRISFHISGEYYEVIDKSVRGMPALWGALIGCYVSIQFVDLKNANLRFLDGVFIVVGIFSLTVVTARFLSTMAAFYAQKDEKAFPSASILANIIEAATYITGILIILQTLGISVTPILTALGVGGLAVALALQDTLSNVFSGLHILLAKPIQTGDYIKLEAGQEGHVVDISWRNTTIQTLGNSLIIVPNQKIASAVIINFDKPSSELSVSIGASVSYDSDLEYVEKVTIAVAKEVMSEFAAGVENYEPVVRFHTFGDSSILFNVIMRVQVFADQYKLKHDFIKRLHKRYKIEGIEIPFPIRTIYSKSIDQ